jgi:cation diffusion facilitator family transporter
LNAIEVRMSTTSEGREEIAVKMINKGPIDLRRYAFISIAAAIATILLKGVAWWLTGSVGLLSDAIESFVNLAGALMALWMLSIAIMPADAEHPHGHDKAEYFSSAFEGFLIVVAAASIGYTAVERLIHPQPLEAVGIGLLVSVLASIINFGVARVLLRAGTEHKSITLEADAHHLMTDVWTSVGVIAGVTLVWLTGLNWLDPVIALLVAANIVWTGWQLMRRSASGLMDVALPKSEIAQIEQVLSTFDTEGVCFHALRTRQAGRRVFISLHVLVPGDWLVKRAHDFSEEIEASLCRQFPHAHVMTHLEPIDDPLSMADEELDRRS